MKLSLKVISIFYVSVLSALMVMAVIGINISIRQAKRNLKEAANIALTSIATTLSEDIGTAFSHVEEIADHKTVATLLTTPKGERSEALLRDAQNLFHHYRQFNARFKYVYLGTEDGSLIVDRYIAMPQGYTPVVRPWYTGALKKPGSPFINDLYQSMPEGEDITSISLAIKGPSGHVAGVVGVDFLFSRYHTIMQNLAFESGFIVITHNNASLIAHSQDPSAGYTSLSTPENRDLALANSAVNGETVIIHGNRYTAYMREIDQYKLKILTFVSECTLQDIRQSYILLYTLTAGVILLIVGITGSRLARNTLRVEQATIRAKQDFFKNMNHEIRTPLNAVVGFIDLLSETPLGQKQKTYVGHTRTAAKHLSGIVNDVLDISSMQAGKYRIVEQPYLFHDLIGHIVALVEQTLRGKDIRLHVSAASEIPHAMLGDSMRLKQVLFNILQNAVKFTDTGIISLRIGCRTDGEQLCLKFTITDTGSGIAPEHLPHIFDEFTQFAATTVQGTGLGLTLTRQLVERMGGSISCTSRPGKGTRFSFHVMQKPVCKKIEASPKKPQVPPAAPSCAQGLVHDFTAPGVSILLVEDDPLSRTMVTELLKGHRMVIHTAETGQAFLDAMASGRTFDLVITDMKLPDINGRDVVRRLKAGIHPPDLPPFIAFSAVDTVEPVKQGPFDAFIRKPIDVTTFRRTLLAWLPKEKIIAGNAIKPAPEPSVDSAAYEKKYGTDLYLKLLRVFLKDHKEGMHLMEGMAREGRFSDLEVRVHRFKGALMNIGAPGPAATAAALEQRLEAGEAIGIGELAPLARAADKVMDEARNLIAELEQATG
ncbi:hybrid sensor histidine kinase/response regulator [Desulfoluna spongiiphila]|uniref:histidine kinase n=1 Tax=Desulfoluna spongiiphila TaxID=419481 RepID=A0A1G5CZW0_9BACT|nr:hybrid sensor histidine kinase/response regulator [Desulfoluna spongiiphila]SCY07817.1 Hpt domain-containing protein [Desulfoluna spongiiphila]